MFREVGGILPGANRFFSPFFENFPEKTGRGRIGNFHVFDDSGGVDSSCCIGLVSSGSRFSGPPRLYERSQDESSVDVVNFV